MYSGIRRPTGPTPGWSPPLWLKSLPGEITEYHCEYYDLPGLKMSPGTHKPMPIMVGGYAPAAMRRASRCDDWMATSHEETAIYPLLKQFNTLRNEEGNGDKPLDSCTGVKNPGAGTHQRPAEAGITMVNGCNFLNNDGRPTLSSIDDKKRRLEDFARRFLR